MEIITDNIEYRNWISELKSHISRSQIKASIAVNKHMITLYWELGKEISKKQQSSRWGAGFIEQLSKDLKAEFPNMNGFSKYNLYHIKNFYLFYSQSIPKVEQVALQLENQIVEQVALQLNNDNIFQLDEVQKEIIGLCEQVPWGHHIVILQKIKNLIEAKFYLIQTVENNWSRSILEYQIETNLFSRQGKAITNFKNTLPVVQGELAQQLFKDPYNFEFLTLSNKSKEIDLERKLIEHITQFLLELGLGFAYLGKQFQIKVGKKEYRTDLLFYHTRLKCYIIIELKMTEFEPEFIGKLNFYLNAVDELIKTDEDKPTIGILLCKNKDDFEVEFSIKNINKPIGVSEFIYTEQLPSEWENAIPSAELIENELKKVENEK